MIYTEDYDDTEPLPPSEAWRVYSILVLVCAVDVTLVVLAVLGVR